MPEQTRGVTAEQQAAADQAPGSPSRLRGLTPIEREMIAKWIESKARTFPRLIAQAEALIAQGSYPPSLPGQLAYWRVAVAVHSQLAWYMRTEKGGPLTDAALSQRTRQVQG